MVINQIFGLIKYANFSRIGQELPDFDNTYLSTYNCGDSGLFLNNKKISLSYNKNGLNLKYFPLSSLIVISNDKLYDEVDFIKISNSKINNIIKWLTETADGVKEKFILCINKYKRILNLTEILSEKVVPSKTLLLTLQNLKIDIISINYDINDTFFFPVEKKTKKKELKKLKKLKKTKEIKEIEIIMSYINSKRIIDDKIIIEIIKEFNINSFLKICGILQCNINKNLKNFGKLERVEKKIIVIINKRFYDLKYLNIKNIYIYIKKEDENCLKIIDWNLESLITKLKIKFKKVDKLEKEINDLEIDYNKLIKIIKLTSLDIEIETNKHEIY